MFDLGIQELIVIFIVALIVFGPKRLPELGRSIGRGVSELKRALEGLKEQVNAEIKIQQKPTEDYHNVTTDTGKERDKGRAEKEDAVDGR